MDPKKTKGGGIFINLLIIVALVGIMVYFDLNARALVDKFLASPIGIFIKNHSSEIFATREQIIFFFKKNVISADKNTWLGLLAWVKGGWNQISDLIWSTISPP
jgi:hypothetical protein